MFDRSQLPLQPKAPGFAIVWVAAIAGLSVFLSLYFACVTPFVALAAVSAVVLPARMAAASVFLAWLANQLVGYLVLDYPQDWDSYAWGLVIAIAAYASLYAAMSVLRFRANTAFTLVTAFFLGFAVYEATLFAATAVLASGEGAFSLPVILQVLAINAAAVIGLLALHAAASAARIVFESRPKMVHAA
jgi:hypothetical protein